MNFGSQNFSLGRIDFHSIRLTGVRLAFRLMGQVKTVAFVANQLADVPEKGGNILQYKSPRTGMRSKQL